MGDVTILVDIDGVLAKHNYQRLQQQYNQSLTLAIPDDQLEDLSMERFQLLVQVQAYKAKVGDERFTWQLAALEWHSTYIFENGVIDGALWCSLWGEVSCEKSH